VNNIQTQKEPKWFKRNSHHIKQIKTWKRKLNFNYLYKGKIVIVNQNWNILKVTNCIHNAIFFQHLTLTWPWDVDYHLDLSIYFVNVSEQIS